MDRMERLHQLLKTTRKPVDETRVFHTRERFQEFLDGLPTLVGKTGLLSQLEAWLGNQTDYAKTFFVAVKKKGGYDLYRCVDVYLADNNEYLFKELVRALDL